MFFNFLPLFVAASVIGVAVFFAWACVRFPIKLVKP